jgi:xyloglucan-specific exo-beta-1,4-glucanase
VHTSLTTPPTTEFQTPTWATTADIDFAGQAPANLARVGTATDGCATFSRRFQLKFNFFRATRQIALSSTSGSSWFEDYAIASGVAGQKVALSAAADTVLMRAADGSIQVSQYQSSFSVVSSVPNGAVIASDKVNGTVFYGEYL